MPGSRRLTAALAVAVALVPAVSQAASDAWTSVIALERGQLVRVVTAESRLRGAIVSADADALTLAVSRQPVAIPRAAVRQVVEIRGRAIGRDALRGLIIGGIAGAAWWAVVSRNRAAGAAAGGALGALDGAIVGALAGIGDRRERVVYEQDSAATPRQPLLQTPP